MVELKETLNNEPSDDEVYATPTTGPGTEGEKERKRKASNKSINVYVHVHAYTNITLVKDNFGQVKMSFTRDCTICRGSLIQ